MKEDVYTLSHVSFRFSRAVWQWKGSIKKSAGPLSGSSIFRFDLEGFVLSKANDITGLVQGNSGRIPQLIAFMQTEVETVLARYSKERPVEVSGAFGEDYVLNNILNLLKYQIMLTPLT
jgi:hypothetical protein